MNIAPNCRHLCLPLAAAVVALAGCHSRSEVFTGKPTNQVWTAMVKAAEQPAYNDWHVIENDVWADEATGRIEIFRMLRRYKDPPGQWARLEDQEWKFAILLDLDEPTPTVSFDVRSFCVPSHSWMEADRYFDQVWVLLGGRMTGPGPSTGEGEATADSSPMKDQSAGNASPAGPSQPATQASDAAKPTAPATEPPVDLPE